MRTVPPEGGTNGASVGAAVGAAVDAAGAAVPADGAVVAGAAVAGAVVAGIAVGVGAAVGSSELHASANAITPNASTSHCKFLRPMIKSLSFHMTSTSAPGLFGNACQLFRPGAQRAQTEPFPPLQVATALY